VTVEIEDILAWVDGELDESGARLICNAVLSDESLLQTAEKLRLSRVLCREACEQSPVPDVPKSLRVKIKALQNSEAQKSID